jgi:outer membrane protein assembly factor BamB
MKSLACAAAGLLTFTLLLSTGQGDDWPQWRGPQRDGISRETGLLKQWPTGGPSRLWLSDAVGLGYSGMAVVGDTLYTMGSHGDVERLTAVSVADGALKWSTDIGPTLSNGWGDGPRGTPTVDGDRVYTISGKGRLVCAAAADGKVLWQVELVGDLGGKTPNWGYTESPLVDGDRVVCTPGGRKGAIAAFNKLDGKLLWQSEEFTDGAQYASVISADLNGVRQYIQLTQQSLVGVNANTGAVLWKTDWPGKTAVIPTPILKDNHIYVTSGYGVGCMLVTIGLDNEVTKVYENQLMKNHHGGVILVGDHLYGYSDGLGWLCQDLMSGERVWNEKNALGKGCLTCADGMLYLQDERSGDIVLIEASPEGWAEHGRFTLEPQTEQRNPKGKIWTHPTVADGKLYLRDQELLFCFDVAAK